MGNRPHLIIMRGLPGSGKSELARKIKKKKYGDTGVILSTDDFCRDKYGFYEFDHSKRNWRHKQNQEKAEVAMKNRVHPIIIDNTNITRRDMEPYVLMGLKYRYYIKFVTTPDHKRCTVDELHARVAHCGIKKGTIHRLKHNSTGQFSEKMAQRRRNRPHLIILRGLPGSGKTKLARNIMEKYGNSGEVLSTDDYFIDEDAQEAIDNGVHPIIIDNTNMRFRDMRPYVEMEGKLWDTKVGNVQDEEELQAS
ncbi:hypothetical protein SKAU_G00325540 [Synaphobranchus kaupii]|uniref:Uncharacterized protein n=1 Tax=Synaphobranchus kaupii TaxID=118154 RepID=A0A9Q1EPJ2_SYNKA|nr:hypothetical protein SKAU_G00325540 [Synaphobranchus kaupii]